MFPILKLLLIWAGWHSDTDNMMINPSIFHLLFWKAKAPLKMSTDWLTVLKSRNTRLDLIMSGRVLELSCPLMTRGEQNLFTTRRPLGWLGSWILSLTEELQSGPLNCQQLVRGQGIFPPTVQPLSLIMTGGGSKQVICWLKHGIQTLHFNDGQTKLASNTSSLFTPSKSL